MLLNLIAITTIAVSVMIGISLWCVSTQRRLELLDESINGAMNQIGIQLSGRFDALTVLLELIGEYARQESETMIEDIEFRRSIITGKSTPADVLHQEGIISEVLDEIVLLSERHQELKADEDYRKILGAVGNFENMVSTSRLVYNDSVSELNNEIKTFPVSMIAGMLGFTAREYFEEQTGYCMQEGA